MLMRIDRLITGIFFDDPRTICIKLIICALNVFPIPFVPKNLENEVCCLSLYSNKMVIELHGVLLEMIILCLMRDISYSLHRY